MPGYFKLKRPFAKKTLKLPDGTYKKEAEKYQSIENQSIELGNLSKKAKAICKELAILNKSANSIIGKGVASTQKNQKTLKKISTKSEELKTIETNFDEQAQKLKKSLEGYNNEKEDRKKASAEFDNTLDKILDEVKELSQL